VRRLTAVYRDMIARQALANLGHAGNPGVAAPLVG